VGREREIATARQLLLREDVRLLTLLGPPGIGKTRLALAVADQLRSDAPDGVCFVPLASLGHADLVTSAIAQRLGGTETGGEPWLTRVQQYLRGKRLVLVLDNFEHVLQAATAVAELLAATATLKVLVTSQAALRLSGEHRLDVPPLPLPDAERLPPAEELLQFDSVRLFMARAQAVRPEFALTQETAADVAAICRRLGGVPLAIELAAARTSLLTPRLLLRGLARPLVLLTDGPRDLPARHQALRSAMAWSYDLLSPPEQALFRRLAVFAGGCTLSAAVAIGTTLEDGAQGSGGVPEETAPDDEIGDQGAIALVASLVEKSLLRREVPVPPREVADHAAAARTVGDGSSEPRLAVLEPIREFALERLAAHGERDVARHWHAEYYLSFAEALEPASAGGQAMKGGESGRPRAWLDRMEAEHDNLRQALEWWEVRAREGKPEPGLRLAGALWPFWFGRGHWHEGHAWLDRMLALGSSAPPQVRLLAVIGAGYPAWNVGTPERAQLRLKERLELSRQLGDDRDIAHALLGLGFLAVNQGDGVRARQWAEESLAMARSVGDRLCTAWSLHLLAQASMRQGDYVRSQALADESLALFRELEDESIAATATALSLQGVLARRRGDRRSAAAHFSESLRLFQEYGAKGGIAAGLWGCGRVALDSGDVAQAVAYFRDGLIVSRDMGNAAGVIRGVLATASAAARSGQQIQAARLLSAAKSGQDALQLPMYTPDRDDYDRDTAAVRARLDPAAFAAAWAEGQAMSLEQSVAAAIGVAAEIASGPRAAGAAESSPSVQPSSRLTRREREVALLVARGLSSREIASKLSITERTAENHVEHILTKLGAHSRVQIATWVVESGLAGSQGMNGQNQRG
jgi:predicted ATPase/DNA-binding CsgD family transcriptional regulator